MTKEEILELLRNVGFGNPETELEEMQLLTFAAALTEPLEQEIAGLEDRHRVALFRLDKSDDLALQRLNSMAKLSSRIAELESALAIADRDRKNAELLVDDAEAERLALASQKDAAYLERNRVVAALAKCFLSGVKQTVIEGWSASWHGCVYINLPTGQASWHFHDSQSYLFKDLTEYPGEWDGHTTEEKYQRIEALGRIVPKEPMSEEDVQRIWMTVTEQDESCVSEFVRAIEAHHGIGGKA